jgi:hypothetical protein
MNPMRLLLRAFDGWLSRQLRVQIFTQDPLCLLRIQVRPLRHALSLPGCRIPPGSQVLMVHMWNERAPMIPPDGPTIAWALDTSRRIRYSLRLVAQYIQANPSCGDVQAVGGISAHIVLGKAHGGKAMLEHLGFVVIPYHRPLGAFGEFWENFYTWWVMWTFNPVSTRRRSMFRLQRTEFWMSRLTFLQLYA